MNQTAAADAGHTSTESSRKPSLLPTLGSAARAVMTRIFEMHQRTKNAGEGRSVRLCSHSRFTCRMRFDCLSRWAAAASAGDYRSH